MRNVASLLLARFLLSACEDDPPAPEEEINLYSAMQNLNAFLSKAFFKWCAAKGIDPDTIENNPRMATYFPDPDDVSGSTSF